jgi:hypothetical protein
MKTKIYLMCAMVVSGMILAFNSLNDEKIKVSVVHHENGQVTILDTVFDSSSGYSVEQFLIDHGFDPNKTEIVNTESFEGKYVAEFRNEFKLEEGSQTFSIDIDIDEKGGESVEIRKVMDDEGNVSIEKKVNGEVVELSEAEKEELMKNDAKVMTRLRSVHSDNKDGNEQEVKIIEIVDGDEKTFEIRLEGGEYEFKGDSKKVMVIEEMEDENGETKVKTRIQSEDGKVLKEVDVNWTEDNGHRKKVFISENPDGEEIEVQVFIDSKDIDKSEILQEDVMEWVGPDGTVKEVIVVKSRLNMNTHISEPMFLRKEEAMKPYTIAIASKLTEPENEPEGEPQPEPVIETFTSDHAKLPIEELKFYPNPTDGNFRMSFFLPQRGQTAITIYDTEGKEVVRKDLGNFQGNWDNNIDLSHLDSGTYILNITQNNLRLAEKIIVN